MIDKEKVFYQDHPAVLQLERIWYIHKYDVRLDYGGPEEGGWWYISGIPTGFSLGPITNEEAAYEQARVLNQLEDERQEREEEYDFTSVLSFKSNHYDYRVEDYPTPEPFPKGRPFYE